MGIVRSVVGNPLRETQHVRLGVGPHPFEVRALDVPDAAVPFVNFVESDPQRERLVRLEHEIVPVLVRRRGVADSRWLGEILHTLGDDGSPE